MNKSTFKNKKIIVSVLFFICASSMVFCQQKTFTIRSQCGFEISIPSMFVKAKDYGFYSDVKCFDTALTNNKGFNIHLRGIDHGVGYKDTLDRLIERALDGYEVTLEKLYFVKSKEILNINDNEIGVITYYEKKQARKKDKVYYQFVVFRTKRRIECLIDMEMPSIDLYQAIDRNIINTIKVTDPSR